LVTTTGYNKRVEEENEKSELELMVSNVGKVDPKNHLETNVQGMVLVPFFRTNSPGFILIRISPCTPSSVTVKEAL
jgi:hypothetical protein